MHSSVVAHQCFALKSLSWLGQIIHYSGTSGLYYPASLSLLWDWLRPSPRIDAGPGIRFCVLTVVDGLRRILCEVGLQSGPQGVSSSLVDQLMLNDSKMWKGTHTFCSGFEAVFIQDLKKSDKFVTAGARNIYHQLLMNSLLMDLKYKKIFAVQFAKVTPVI